MFYISFCIISCPCRLVKTKNIFLKNKRFKKPQPFPLFYPAIQYFTPFLQSYHNYRTSISTVPCNARFNNKLPKIHLYKKFNAPSFDYSRFIIQKEDLVPRSSFFNPMELVVRIELTTSSLRVMRTTDCAIPAFGLLYNYSTILLLLQYLFESFLFFLSSVQKNLLFKINI